MILNKVFFYPDPKGLPVPPSPLVGKGGKGKRECFAVGISPFFSFIFHCFARKIQQGREFSTSSFSLKQQKRSNLDSLLDSFPSLSENLYLYITSPRHPKINECHEVLLRMMHNSIADPVVKLFIKNNCLHLMSLDKYTKEINPKDYIDYPIDGPDKQGHPSLYAGKSGCYAFLCLKTGDYYVGSAICLNTRYKTHKVRSSRPERGGSTSLYLSVREHGWHNFI